jgi:hypothetical protein
VKAEVSEDSSHLRHFLEPPDQSSAPKSADHVFHTTIEFTLASAQERSMVTLARLCAQAK